MLLAAGVPVGGLVGPRPEGPDWPSGGPQPHWVAYFGTDDVDTAARTAEQLGGTVLVAPVDVPGFGRASVLRDPQGGVFGVFAPASRP
jgi:predicted enzyme related to lactoylglutathione lyase